MTALAGRYTLDVPLGDSDLGTVWNAHDQDGTLLVVVTLEEDAPEALQDRFRAHAKALTKITHPSVVHAIAEGEENGSPYLVLERLTGESLASRLEGGPAPTVGRMVEIAVTLSEALTAVHAAGISHGDVEPGNVLLVGEPGKEVPKLIGFALNRASIRQELGTRASLPSLGPVAYAAPEQARGEAIDGPLADQASLAALVYAALSGRPPHIARDIAGLATAIANDKAPTLTLARRELAPFASTIDKALSPDPKKRFAEIGAFGRALKTAGNMARTVATSPVPLGERSAIGEPPAPALPKAATIPKPSPTLGAAKLAPMGPGKPAVVIPRPGAASRTTQELDISDLKPATAAMAQPSARPTEELQIADILAATGAQPKIEAEPAKAEPTKAEPVKAEPVKAEPAKAMFLPPLVPKAEPAKPEPVKPPAVPSSSESSPELESVDLQSIPPDAPRNSDPDSVELTSIPPAAPDEHVDAKPPPPPPPHDHADAKPPPPPPPSHDHADHKPPPPPPAAKKDVEKPVVVDEPSVSLSPSLEKIAIAEAAKPKPPPPSFPPAAAARDSGDSDAPPYVRPAWVIPASIALLVLVAVVSAVGWQMIHGDTSVDAGTPGHTLTTTVPETSVTPPPTTVIAVPPPTEVTPPPPTTIVAPPATRVLPPSTRVPPSTGVRPPITTRPPTTSVRPPTTSVRPPTTSVRPPPTTGTRPPPTTGVRRPPPTTTTRPTVVSDPGF